MPEQETDSKQEHKLTDVDLLRAVINRVLEKRFNQFLLESDLAKALSDWIKIVEYKTNICFELLTENQREQARKLMQERFSSEKREWEPVEDILKRSGMRL